MNMLSCPRCGYKTDRVGNLHLHFGRKTPCRPKVADIPFGSLYQMYYG